VWITRLPRARTADTSIVVVLGSQQHAHSGGISSCLAEIAIRTAPPMTLAPWDASARVES
jgi:hypothetical protein